jgi:renalase
MSKPMKKIAIIGAGIAGLACAQVLSARGLAVSVFDKGRGPGGRMSTRRASSETGELFFDHGAQYFTARDRAFVSEIERLMGIGAVAPWVGDLVVLDKEGLNHPLAQEPVYVGTPGMNGVIKALATPLDVTWNCRVETITRHHSQWHLTSDTGQSLGDFDHVVCAVPAEQVSPLLQAIAPRMAAMSLEIASLPCWAGLFAFAAPLSMPFDAIRFKDHPMLDFVAINASKPARVDQCTYVVHARADWSVAHLEEPADVIAEHLLQGLLSFADNKPNNLYCAAHRWRYARVDVTHGIGCVYDETLGLGVCGDWLSGPRVESAWLSGHELGHKIWASLKV